MRRICVMLFAFGHISGICRMGQSAGIAQEGLHQSPLESMKRAIQWSGVTNGISSGGIRMQNGFVEDAPKGIGSVAIFIANETTNLVRVRLSANSEKQMEVRLTDATGTPVPRAIVPGMIWNRRNRFGETLEMPSSFWPGRSLMLSPATIGSVVRVNLEDVFQAHKTSNYVAKISIAAHVKIGSGPWMPTIISLVPIEIKSSKSVSP